MGLLNDDGKLTDVAAWVNNRVVYAELEAFRQGAPRDFVAPITLWGLLRQFYVEQIEDHSASGKAFMECDGAVQLACIVALMHRGAVALDRELEASSSDVIEGLEALLNPGSVLDTDEPAGYDDQPGSSEDL